MKEPFMNHSVKREWKQMRKRLLAWSHQRLKWEHSAEITDLNGAAVPTEYTQSEEHLRAYCSGHKCRLWQQP